MSKIKNKDKDADLIIQLGKMSIFLSYFFEKKVCQVKKKR